MEIPYVFLVNYICMQGNAGPKLYHDLIFKLFILYSRVIEEIVLKAVEHSSSLMHVLLSFLQDGDTAVIKQSIVSGTRILCSVLEEMTLQVFFLHCFLFHGHGDVITCLVPQPDCIFNSFNF